MSIPPSFDPDAARDALDGDIDALDTFVIHIETPQGYAFWAAEAICRQHGEPLSDEAREQIEAWLMECDE